MKMTKQMTTVRFTGNELTAVKEALRLLGLEMRRKIGTNKRSVEFSLREGLPLGSYPKWIVRDEQLAAGGRLAEGTIARAEKRAAR